MEWFLVVATILGGIAALWFFSDKILGKDFQQPKQQTSQIGKKLVDIKYPHDSGLQAKLELDGYDIGWCAIENVARSIDIEGYGYVIEVDRDGKTNRLTTGDLILLKKEKLHC